MSPLPFRLAVCLMTCRGNLDMAADAAEQAARLAPHDASVLMQLGVSAARVQRYACSCNFCVGKRCPQSSADANVIVVVVQRAVPAISASMTPIASRLCH